MILKPEASMANYSGVEPSPHARVTDPKHSEIHDFDGFFCQEKKLAGLRYGRPWCQSTPLGEERQLVLVPCPQNANGLQKI
ncbi:hypothetical protein Ddc_04610 [Ditylenchus destructor]|nr:hypothetical protein Ddc_04610 [Ditylenchus destructor]